ncbi:MAG: hypothetical protein JOZ13_17730 [Alphaproteobacteria bacterium]|nr:hypothetical protein [Alphaproteobacteria bacterium]
MIPRCGIAFCLCLLSLSSAAHAEGLTVSLEAGSERTAADFSKALLNYDIVSLTKDAGNGLSWTLQVQNYRARTSGAVSWAGEGLVTYRRAMGENTSLYASLGGGERFAPTRDFPYLTVRLGADDTLGSGFTWNALNLRYRTGFDQRYPYHSTTAGTGLTYRTDRDVAIYGRVFAAFDTGYRFAGTGVGLGLRFFL